MFFYITFLFPHLYVIVELCKAIKKKDIETVRLSVNTLFQLFVWSFLIILMLKK